MTTAGVLRRPEVETGAGGDRDDDRDNDPEARVARLRTQLRQHPLDLVDANEIGLGRPRDPLSTRFGRVLQLAPAGVGGAVQPMEMPRQPALERTSARLGRALGARGDETCRVLEGSRVVSHERPCI